jgi:hypothetical protein
MRKLILIAIWASLLTCTALAVGQYTLVKRATAETADGLRFTVWTEGQTVTYGKDIVLHYKVENRSRGAVYLVRKDSLEYDNEGGRILIASPIPIPVGHGDYDYSFLKIGRGHTYRGQITIPMKAYNDLDIWPIDVGFGYVTDVTGLNRKLRPGEDPARLRGALRSRLKTAVVGSLSVKIVEG